MEHGKGWLYVINLLFKKFGLGRKLWQYAVDMPVKPLWFLLKQGGISCEIWTNIKQGIVHTTKYLKDMLIVEVLLYIGY